jgi:predicted Zn-dependent protease with MMP-like domain
MIAQDSTDLTHVVFLEKTTSLKMFLQLNFGDFSRFSAPVYASAKMMSRVYFSDGWSPFSHLSQTVFPDCARLAESDTPLMEFETLSGWADEELKSLIKILPDDVKAAAQKVPVTMESKPGDGPDDESLIGDELGLFEGSSAAEEADPADLPRIRLFLANIWEWVEEDEQDFRDEVGTTFLHELGHYLGWDEDEVADRGLE